VQTYYLIVVVLLFLDDHFIHRGDVVLKNVQENIIIFFYEIRKLFLNV